ncbi:MAG: UDP-3-O-(3-hydroxymyristoyl)glucosamine N-acyltransferase [Candidatus Thorarchaeota archaeon]
MTISDILKKYGIPQDAASTCAIQSLVEKHIAYINQMQFLKHISPNKGAYILVEPKFFDRVSKIEGNTYIEVENPLIAFLEIHNEFHKDVKSFTPDDSKPTMGKGCEIESTARFGKNVNLGNRVKIHPYVVVGSDVTIGDDSEVFSNTAIYDRVKIGRRNIIDANASIGGDGYRIMRDAQNRIHRLIHIGGVRFGDDVEFGNSSCVDRGTFGDTILEDRVKIDNMVHIGHNVHIKTNTQLAASSCIGGSTEIGENCWIGIGATVSNGLTLGDNSSVLINAVVVRDVPDNETVSGFYAMPNLAWRLVVKDHAKRFGTKAAKLKKRNE